jgi:hypothetical protein
MMRGGAMVKTGGEGDFQWEAMQRQRQFNEDIKAAIQRIEDGQRTFAQRLSKIEKQLGIGSQMTR